MPTLNSVLVNKIKVVLLSPESRSTLLTGYKQGKTHSYRLRCQALLLKSDVTKPRTSLAVAEQIGCCEMAVNNWMKRYEAEGIDGLRLKPGRGRKGILQKQSDFEAVRRAVASHRQRIGLAKADLEKELGKAFSTMTMTLPRFLKKMVTQSCQHDRRPTSNDCESA